MDLRWLPRCSGDTIFSEEGQENHRMTPWLHNQGGSTPWWLKLYMLFNLILGWASLIWRMVMNICQKYDLKIISIRNLWCLSVMIRFKCLESNIIQRAYKMHMGLKWAKSSPDIDIFWSLFMALILKNRSLEE